MSLFDELQRRNVVKVGLAYLIVGWVIIQVVDATFPDLGLPDSYQTIVLFLVLTGLPVAILFAWFFGPRLSHEPEVEKVKTPHQEVRFCVAKDGTRLAYANVGDGPLVVKTANWLNHLEYDWESPIWSHLVHAFAERYRLVRYDERGTGLSDWDVDEISYEALYQDLETVIDKVGGERPILFGVSQGCAIAVDYAVRHPDRVRGLILYGGFAQGIYARGDAEEVEQRKAVTQLMISGWGQDNPAFRQIYTSLMLPGGTKEQMNWYNELQKRSASPENALRIRRTIDRYDVLHLLPEVNVPTIVLHARGDQSVKLEYGRQMAAGIPGAKFVELDGNNHLMLEDEPAWPRFIEEVEGFIASLAEE